MLPDILEPVISIQLTNRELALCIVIGGVICLVLLSMVLTSRARSVVDIMRALCSLWVLGALMYVGSVGILLSIVSDLVGAWNSETAKGLIILIVMTAGPRVLNHKHLVVGDPKIIPVAAGQGSIGMFLIALLVAFVTDSTTFSLNCEMVIVFILLALSIYGAFRDESKRITNSLVSLVVLWMFGHSVTEWWSSGSVENMAEYATTVGLNILYLIVLQISIVKWFLFIAYWDLFATIRRCIASNGYSWSRMSLYCSLIILFRTDTAAINEYRAKRTIDLWRAKRSTEFLRSVLRWKHSHS